ncbi:hypothetical protein [Streptosporangium sp. NPDC049376]|uniref:hypothetical protein n=1 Tax=Streptosporangium sp. NPDC049376 TaxID=3366192 RepID=UPI003795E466
MGQAKTLAQDEPSLTVIIEAPRIMLLQIFAAWLAPGSPQRTTLRPMADSNSETAAKSVSGMDLQWNRNARQGPRVPPKGGGNGPRPPEIARQVVGVEAGVSAVDGRARREAGLAPAAAPLR